MYEYVPNRFRFQRKYHNIYEVSKSVKEDTPKFLTTPLLSYLGNASEFRKMMKQMLVMQQERLQTGVLK